MPPPVNEAPRYVTVRDYVRVARERRLLIVVLMLLCGAAGYYYSARQNDVYKTEATIEFQSQNTQTSLFGQLVDQGGQTPEQRAALAASTLVRPEVLERAKKILDYDGPAAALGALVVARAEARTNLVVVTGAARNGKGAADLANAVARGAVAQARVEARRQYARTARAQRQVLRALRKEPGAFFTRTVTLQQIARLDQLARVATPAVLRREATAPDEPTSPHIVRTTLLGLLVGLTLGLVGAFFRDSMDGRMRSTGEITDELDLHVLGHVPEKALGSGLVKGKRRWWQGARAPLSETDLEGVRILRKNIEFLSHPEPPKLVMITSAVPAEGKSTVATALAAAYALAGKRTLIVEADLRRPTLAGRLGIAKSPGLTDYLTGRAEPDEVLQTIALPELPAGTRAADAPAPGPIVAIAAGAPVSQPAELLRSERCQSFLADVRRAYDVVIVDTAPLLAVVDPLELVPVADAVVLCARGSRTPRAQLEAAKAMLEKLPHGPVGVVVTGLRVGEEEPHYGYYGYAAQPS